MTGISIIVCTYNGYDRLIQALNCLTRQIISDSNSCELLIIDNGSVDGSYELLCENISNFKFPFPYKLLRESKPGKINALILGAYTMKYSHLLICDDDNLLQEDYVQTAYRILEKNHEIGALGGCGSPLFLQTKPTWFDKYSHSYGIGPQNKSEGRLEKYPAELYGAGAIFKVSSIKHFYDSGLRGIMSGRINKKLNSGEDVEWCYIVQFYGLEVWYSSNLKFKHLMPGERLSWDYYLRLKAGISSSHGKLFSYRIFFKSTKAPDILLFCISYFATIIKLSGILMLYSFKLKILMFKYNKDEMTLAKVVLKNSLKSYLLDFKASFLNFLQLRRFIMLIK